MRYLQIFILSSLFVVSPIYASAGHDHGDSHSHANKEKDDHSHEEKHSHSHVDFSKQSAIDKATQKINQLASNGKIDKSWSTCILESAEKKTIGDGTEWLVVFNNKNLADKSKQKLHVFYTLEGRYLATNYTGK